MPMLLHVPTRLRAMACNDRCSIPGSFCLTCAEGGAGWARQAADARPRVTRACPRDLRAGCAGDTPAPRAHDVRGLDDDAPTHYVSGDDKRSARARCAAAL